MVALHARPSGTTLSVEHAYPGMAVTDQIINSGSSSRHVVHVEVVKGQIVLTPIFLCRLEPYNGDPSFQQGDQISGRKVEEHPDHSIDPPLLDRPQAPPFLLGNAACVVDDQVVPVGFGRLLNASFKGGVEGIGNVRNNARDRIGLTRTETACGAIGNVPEFVYSIQDALPGLHGY